MADKRAFAVFDVGYLDNPKIIEILDESTEAVMMHAYSVLYSSQHLTDGHVPVKRMVKHIGGSQSDVDLLTNAGLWHLDGHQCAGCPQPRPGRIYVHDYLQHNRTKASTEKRSEDAKKANEIRWGKSSETDSQSDPDRSPEGIPTGLPKDEVRNPQTDRQTDSSSSAKSTRKHAQPSSWKPNDTHRQKAKEHGLDVSEQSETFTDWHAARGSKFVDWDRAFNSWLKKAVEFKAERQASEPSSSYIWDSN